MYLKSEKKVWISVALETDTEKARGPHFVFNQRFHIEKGGKVYCVALW